jgi:hypothetical protein
MNHKSAGSCLPSFSVGAIQHVAKATSFLGFCLMYFRDLPDVSALGVFV